MLNCIPSSNFRIRSRLQIAYALSSEKPSGHLLGKHRAVHDIGQPYSHFILKFCQSLLRQRLQPDLLIKEWASLVSDLDGASTNLRTTSRWSIFPKQL